MLKAKYKTQVMGFARVSVLKELIGGEQGLCEMGWDCSRGTLGVPRLGVFQVMAQGGMTQEGVPLKAVVGKR